MSKGSPVIRVRVPAELKAAMANAIEQANAYTRDEPYTGSSWIRKAIADKLNHLQRRRLQQARKLGAGKIPQGSAVNAD